MSALVADKTRTSTRRVFDDPTRSNSPGFEDAQELGLQIQRDIGNFVEKERSSVRQFEPANAIRFGIGESAFDVAEQLTFKNAFGKPAGIHRDHGPQGAIREGVQSCAPPPPCPFRAHP